MIEIVEATVNFVCPCGSFNDAVDTTYSCFTNWATCEDCNKRLIINIGDKE